MGIVDVRNLTFSYDQETNAVEEVSFSVEKGTYTTIVGHNGSGKSTVAKLITGLLERKSGDIQIEGMELDEEHLRAIRSKIGIVFQNPDNQFIGSTVRDDIAFGLENHCVPQEQMDDLINTYAAKVGMTDYLGSEPTHLSGGQKQRVAIAGVLAMHPDILIFDEATSMLDPQGKAEIKKVIMELHKESGLTILSITHDIDEVVSSDYVIAMHEGHVAMTGTPEEIFRQEKKLEEIQLDLPFSVKLIRELKKDGVKVGRTLTMEGLVDELCRLHSNM
ncbi:MULTISPECIES: energy-coupling factor transporter ATPase [Erysipelotrichaceae]|jgi:energy-coupling factor transport system ATP-binding protein|uniref:energy-coupling factor transporter ATPase n=1 Tax=Erysipelotrichaceae TaxID=128827 RepID=UPI000CF8D616|nr:MULTISPECIES: energy-coupling factor transporter ATPase [Erysipelotrichaceae]MDD5880813.1 energy-coupling factor transporter ATPase [Stecheria intestinalis]MDY3233688.1 energy-coupling factor transporter ATPase [Erysipelotrichaceae bacterium]MDY4681572.1 energy-coupling factor transporter ATPase [Lachnospiraceae bacterium]